MTEHCSRIFVSMEHTSRGSILQRDSRLYSLSLVPEQRLTQHPTVTGMLMARKPQMDIGEDVVSPYLWSRRIRHLDYAVLTHGHSDHMGGLDSILDNFRPRALWVGAEPETAEWKAANYYRAKLFENARRPL